MNLNWIRLHNRRLLAFVLISLGIFTAFQNCGSTFEVGSDSLDSLSGGPIGVQILMAPQAWSNDGSATISFGKSSETLANVTFNCQLDGGTVSGCVSPVTFSGLAEGPHLLLIQAVDTKGNLSDLQAVGFVVDTTAPTILIVQQPATTTTSTSASITFSAFDSLSGLLRMECSFDNQPFTACAGSASSTGLSVGTHTFSVKAFDRAGNESAPTTVQWTISSNAPTGSVSITSAPPANSNVGSATFAFSGTSSVIGYMCSLDGAPFETCTNPKTYTNLIEGVHQFAVYGQLSATANTATQTYQWKVDLSPPTIVIVSKPDLITSSTAATFVYGITDNVSGVAAVTCTLDNVSVNCTGTGASFTSLSVGTHQFSVSALDGAGNSTASTYAWSVTTTSPPTNPPPSTDTNPPPNPGFKRFTRNFYEGTRICFISLADELWCVDGNYKAAKNLIFSDYKIFDTSIMEDVIAPGYTTKYSCIIKLDKTVLCHLGRMKLGGSAVGYYPVALPEQVTRVVTYNVYSYAPDDMYACALAISGNVYCWSTANGSNVSLISSISSASNVDVSITKGSSPSKVDVRVRRSNGDVYGLADGVVSLKSREILEMRERRTYNDTGTYSYGIDISGAGKIISGAPGLSDANDILSLGNKNFKIVIGDRHGCALKDGAVQCYSNINRNLTSSGLFTPAIPTDITDIEANGNYACAGRPSGAVYCWKGYGTTPSAPVLVVGQ